MPKHSSDPSSREALLPAPLPPPPASLSAFSSSGRFLATAVASSASPESADSQLPRSRVKVWDASSGGDFGTNAVSASESDGVSGLSFVSNYQPRFSVEWQRQFLGHSVTSLLFVSRASAGGQRMSERLLIGTDRGMLASADVTASSSKLLFSTYLGEASESSAGGSGAESSFDSTKGSSDFPIRALGCTAASGGNVVALVGGRDGSRLVTVDPEDGTVVRQDELSKPYNLFASPSSTDADEDVVLLAMRRGTTELGSSAGVVLYDVQHQRPRAKLVGGSGGAFAVALEKRARFAAGVFSGSGKDEQHAQLVVWQIPDRSADAAERAAAKGKSKKLQPACSGSHFEPLIQVVLPTNRDAANAEDASDSGDDEAAHPYSQQAIVTLSRSNAVIVWALGRDAGAEGQSFSLVKVAQIDSVSFPCISPKASLDSAPALAAAVATPGVWFMQELDESGRARDEDATSPSGSSTKKRRHSAGTEHPAQERQHLCIVRGCHTAPLFQCLLLPRFASRRSSAQELYLPLLPRYSGKFGLACVEAMKLSEVRAAGGDSRKAGEKTGSAAASAGDDGANRVSLPTASLKRTIAAVTESDGDDVDASGDSGAVEEGKKKKQSNAKGLGLAGAATGGAPGGEHSNVAVILRQALTASDARLLETVLTSTAKDKKEVAAGVGSLTPVQALRLLQHLVQQQQVNPAASITKGGWIEEIVKQHAVVLSQTDAGREQLVLLLLQVEERRRSESALVKVKGRLELLLQQMQRVQRLREERGKEEKEAREPLVVHKERANA
ncbi:conserved hypothetical protein [Neospora caninum Liverpool]|uniref:Small-subunit processome Utp12 domain-containing protein n=1 Tax=Neospora caninum (strain Liverpool) TaxID=572307 RepID=F0VF75_NEOCL|nr:conserved hypothetical protein [Neospora caninum Liverpool]CBZ52369.1 conserved hypothetical protein [Neospora caninum Liverpool]CEL66340.1 TPA: hypothetical protein BN1204_021570 [Neospora caninum Liverpool]|eukprot:XP_003882401.1 conserved hypothetical protein [Neospora caninum Liverpool]